MLFVPYLLLIFTVPMAGFIYGVLHADGCDTLIERTIGRAFIGFVFAILFCVNPLHPPLNEGTSASANGLPYLLVSALLLTLLATGIAYKIG